MPLYEYEHLENSCEAGASFDVKQVSHDWPLTKCPYCGGPVKRIMQAPTIITKKSNSELKDAGFTKLVRVDDGIFENVTRRDGETQFVDRRKPETFPHLHKTIED